MKYIWTILCLNLLQFVLASTLQVKTCRPTAEVLEEIRKRYRIKLNTAKLNVFYDFNQVRVQKSSKGTKVLLSNTTVLMRVTRDIVENGKNKIGVYKAHYETKPITIEYTTKLENGKTSVSCSMPSSQITIPKTPKNNLAMINQLVEYCIDLDVCGRISSFTEKSLIINENRVLTSKTGDYNPQKTINAIADFAISVLLNKIPNIASGSVELPDVAQNFSTGSSFWKVTGDVMLTNGSFQGLDTLKRIDNLVLKNDRLKFSVAASYKLETAILRYDHYDLRYGYIPVRGNVGADINNLTVIANAVFDFNAKPCHVYLQRFDIDLEKFDPEFTGLGFMINAAVKGLARLALRSYLLDWVKTGVQQQLEEVNCELYRPAAIDLLKSIALN